MVQVGTGDAWLHSDRPEIILLRLVSLPTGLFRACLGWERGCRALAVHSTVSRLVWRGGRLLQNLWWRETCILSTPGQATLQEQCGAPGGQTLFKPLMNAILERPTMSINHSPRALVWFA